jgi:hypothetical protein
MGEGGVGDLLARAEFATLWSARRAISVSRVPSHSFQEPPDESVLSRLT